MERILTSPSIVPDEMENLLNDPVAFLRFMMPDVELLPWQEEILRSTWTDPRWAELVRRMR